MSRPSLLLSPSQRADRYRVAVKHVADYAMFLMDRNGTILDWNHAAELMKGYPAEEAIGHFFGMLYTDELQAQEHPRANLEAAARDGTFQEESWRKKKDGSIFWAHIELIAFYDDAGEVDGFCKLTQDLTARKCFEDQLSAAQALTQQILEAAQATTWQWDSRTGKVAVSTGFIESLGYVADTAPATGSFWEALVHPDDLRSLQEAVAAVLQGVPVAAVEFRLRRQDGAYRWFYTRPSLRRGDKDESLVVTGVTLDTHERKEAALERERLTRELAAERERALAILEQMPVAVVLADAATGSVIHHNGEATRLFGSDLRLMNELTRKHGDASSSSGEEGSLLFALASGQALKGEEFRCKWDGHEHYFSINAGPVTDSDGIARIAVAVFSDIQMLKTLQGKLHAEKERAQVTVSSIGDAVVSTDTDGRITDFNPAAERLTGWQRTDAMGRFVAEVLDMVDDESGKTLDHFIDACLKEGRTTDLSPRALLRRKEGSPLSIEDVAAPIRLPDGTINGLVIVFRDVTESRRMVRALTHQATHDALTGLFNRLEFENRVKRAVERAMSLQTESALLYMDLDQFKIVNDSCGHKAGDELLRQLSQRFRSEMRERDSLARLGGDEFGLLVEHCTLEEALRVAHKVLETTREFQFPFDNRVFRVGISIGLVPITASSQNAQQVMQRADHACYIAKEAGRNRVHIQREEDAMLRQRQSDMNWVSRIGDALHDDGLQLFFQSIVPVAGAGGLHYEILLRLRDGPGDWIQPGSFLPAAERYDLMPSVDLWVLRNTIRWLEAHPEHLARLEWCSINLSARSLADERFQQHAVEVLEQCRLPLDKLCFEITETAAIAQLQKTSRFIALLKKRGCRFALDDFGTGMASFSYLKHLPVDFIKIDGSFVSAMRESKVDAEMVKSVNEIGHIMGKKTVAEWVADEETLALLSAFGVDYAQGFWIAAPECLAA